MQRKLAQILISTDFSNAPVEQPFSETIRVKSSKRNRLGETTQNYIPSVIFNSLDDISDEDSRIIGL